MKFQLLILIVLVGDIVCFQRFQDTKTQKSGQNQAVIHLYGNYFQMGYEYGQVLQSQLSTVYNILYNYFVVQYGMSYDEMLQQTQQFYDRFSYQLQTVIQGIAKGSGLTLEQCIILNGMEVITPGNNQQSLSQCAYFYIYPEQTQGQRSIIGRNYDYFAPFDQIAQYTTLTVFHHDDTITTMIIAFPGQIYCPSCINSQGLFLEINNGMPSGGFQVDTGRKTLLANNLENLQNSNTLDQLWRAIEATEGDFSLIVNSANQTVTKSFEFSSTLGMRPNSAQPPQAYVSTNYFLNQTWYDQQLVPPATDNSTWIGVTRRNNLIKQLSNQTQYTVDDVKQLMEITVDQGGAFNSNTVYQFIIDYNNYELHMKIVNQNWTLVELFSVFQ